MLNFLLCRRFLLELFCNSLFIFVLFRHNSDADEFRMVDETGRGVEPPSIPRRSSSFIQQPYLSLAASAKLTVAKVA